MDSARVLTYESYPLAEAYRDCKINLFPPFHYIYIYMTIHPLGTRSLLQQIYHCSPQEDGGDCTAAGGDEGEGEGEGVREATTARARREAAVGVPPESIAVAGRCPWVCGRPITLVHFIK